MTFKKLWKEWILPFGIEVLVLLLIVKFVFFFVIVPTGSMIPTIDEHSLLFAWHVGDASKLERGDIVVFKSEELGKTLVKRLIGLPGEHIEITGSDVYIDGQKLDEPYVVNQSQDDCMFDLEEDEYFFLGDNRSGSLDARYWDNPFIKGDAIVGRAVFTLWPLSNFGTLK